MAIFKYLIAFNFLLTGLPDDGVDGWYSVPKTVKTEDQGEEDDPTIWVLFAKKLDSEQFHVRFPETPKYRYAKAGKIEITSEKNGEIFQLTVGPAGIESLAAQDLHYEFEGKWVREHFVRTSNHFFHFKTTSLTPNAENHREFISSFFIEEIG